MRQTHTFAVLELSQSAYLEIRKLLEDAGYQHAFTTSDGRPVIDMQGIAVASKVRLEGESVQAFRRRQFGLPQ